MPLFQLEIQSAVHCWFLLIVRGARTRDGDQFMRGAYVRSHRAADNWLRVFWSVTMFIRAQCSYHYFIISKKVIVRAAWRGSRWEAARKKKKKEKKKRAEPLRYYFINIVLISLRVTRIVRSWLLYIRIIYRLFSFPAESRTLTVIPYVDRTICSTSDKNAVSPFSSFLSLLFPSPDL